MINILVDSVDIPRINKLKDYYELSGITSNPSIISKSYLNPKETFIKLKEFIKENYEIHIQTTEEECLKIVNEAKKLREFFGEKFFIKIPISPEGLKATKKCSELGINVTMTAIFTPLRVLSACNAGASYVAPYINRIANSGGNYKEIVADMIKVSSDYETKILAASFKNIEQIKDVIAAGVKNLTISPNIIEESIWHPYTDKSIINFNEDWNKKFPNKKVVDFL